MATKTHSKVNINARIHEINSLHTSASLEDEIEMYLKWLVCVAVFTAKFCIVEGMFTQNNMTLLINVFFFKIIESLLTLFGNLNEHKLIIYMYMQPELRDLDNNHAISFSPH